MRHDRLRCIMRKRSMRKASSCRVPSDSAANLPGSNNGVVDFSKTDIANLDKQEYPLWRSRGIVIDRKELLEAFARPQRLIEDPAT